MQIIWREFVKPLLLTLLLNANPKTQNTMSSQITPENPIDQFVRKTFLELCRAEIIFNGCTPNEAKKNVKAYMKSEQFFQTMKKITEKYSA